MVKKSVTKKKEAVKKATAKKKVNSKKKVAKKSTSNNTKTVSRARKKTLSDASIDQIKPIVKKTRFAPLTPEQKELVLAVYCYRDNVRETARITGVSIETVTKIRDEAFDSGELHELRSLSRENHVSESWGIIGQARAVIKDGLTKGYLKEKMDENGVIVEMVTNVSPSEASRVIRDLHHTAQLEEGKPTSIVEHIADSMTEDEILAEIERTETALEKNAGRLH